MTVICLVLEMPGSVGREVQAISEAMAAAGLNVSEFWLDVMVDGLRVRMSAAEREFSASVWPAGAGAVPSQHVLVKSAVESQFETDRLNLSNRSSSGFSS